MKKITVPFKGIIRNTDDELSSDGEMAELINARISNGSVQPVGRPILEKSLSNSQEPIFIHTNGSYEHVISYATINGVGRLIYDYDRSLDTYTPVNSGLSLELSGKPILESVGNTLIIITSDNIYYALFKNGEYKVLGDKPKFTNMSIYSEIVYHDNSDSRDKLTYSNERWSDFNPDVSLENGKEVDLVDDNVTLLNNSLRASLNRYMNTLRNDYEFVYPMVVRYALRMYDGSYIMHSAPILIREKSNIDIYITAENPAGQSSVTDFHYKLGAYPYKLKVNANLSSLKDWKDIITSVDVFISELVPSINTEKDVTSITCTGMTDGAINISVDFNRYSSADMKERLENTTNFYKVKSYAIEDTTTVISSDLIESSQVVENLEQKEALPLDSYTHHQISGGCSYVYNGRLHLGNITTIFPAMLPINVLQSTMDLSSRMDYITANTEIQLKTSNGVKTVHGTTLIYPSVPITPYISYPDSRAFRLVLYFTYNNANYYKVFDLKAHDQLNTAYNFDTYDNYIIDDNGVISSLFTVGTYTPVSEDNTDVEANKIKVSEVNNPFYFPSGNTYTVSNTKVTGMASATTALSSGQFGQFPLYVFSKDGVYALSVGTGNVLYTTTHPVSRDCCNNEKSIVGTDTAVIFSTGSGLKMISGSTVVDISTKIKGFLPSLLGESIISKIASIASYASILSSTEFVYFLENCIVGYCYGDKEIIVSNPNYEYSYVYSMESAEWHKASYKVVSFLNSYPDCLAILKDGGMYNMYNQHRTVNKILMLTRPVKFGSTTYKRILQSAVRGVMRPSLSDVYIRGEQVQYRSEEVDIFSEAGFYILGSNDAEHFTFLSGTEKLADIRDLITKMNKTKAYKYFMFCIVGGVRTDVSLNYIEVIADETYTNRLN